MNAMKSTKFRFAVMLGLYLWSSAVCFAQTETKIERVEVAKDNIELRSGPSETASILRTLEQGLILRIQTRISTNWLLVKVDDQMSGYVNADDVAPYKEIVYCKFEDGIGGRDVKSKTEIPGKEESIALAKDTLLAFNDALIAKDFTLFRDNSIAEIWRKKSKSGDFRMGFKEFLDKEIEIGRIRTVEPVFNPCPYIGTKYKLDTLFLKGVFKTEWLPVNFDLEYIRENDEWKLVFKGIDTRRK